MKSRTISKIIRMTPEEKRRLEYCAEKMAKTETEILIAGVNNYYAAVHSSAYGFASIFAAMDSARSRQ